MVGIGISSASAGSDAVSLAKSSRSSSSSSSDGSTGFSDALSNSGNGRDANTPSKASAADANSADAGSAQGDGSQTQGDASQPAASSATAASGNAGKASDALKAQGAAQSFAQSLNAMPHPAQALPIATDTATATTADDASKTSLADVAQQLAAMVDGDASGQPAIDAKGNLSTVKGGKATDKASDDDANASDATAATTTISDALSLLGALPVTVVPAQTAASVLAAAGQLHTGNGKVVASDGSVDGVSSEKVGDKADAVATGMAMLASTAIGSGSADAGTATDSDDATQTFSVARASSKVQALDLAASKNADDAAQLDLKTAAGDGTGTITVLESRRFVGLADGSNSSLVANSLTGNKDWAAAMAPSAALTGASATTSASKVMNSLKIQMNPDNLGIVTATMRLSGDQLSVDLKVQSAEAYRQLSNDQSAMVDSLRQQGYSVDRITVSYTAPDTSSNNQSGYQGQQQQQSGTSQGQSSDAQARKQNSGQQAGDQDAVWGTGNVGADDSVAGSAQRARAGGVYL